MHDPVSGPMPRAEFQALVDAPFGAALTAIRKYDPFYGRKPGEKIRWRVTFKREITEEGEAIVEADNEKEAKAIARDLQEYQISWDGGCSYGNNEEIFSIEPVDVVPRLAVLDFPF